MKSQVEIQKRVAQIRRNSNSTRYRHSQDNIFAWSKLHELAENCKDKSQEDYESLLKSVSAKKDTAFKRGDDKYYRAYLKQENLLKWILDAEDRVCQYCKTKCDIIDDAWICPNCWLPHIQNRNLNK